MNPGYDQRMDLAISNATDAARYEARLDGELAGIIDYVDKRERIALVHTEVMAGFEGRGVAAALARFAFDDARARRLRVIAICPFVRSWLKRHPEEADIVVGKQD